MSSLEELIQALPPELYNEVVRITFTASATPRHICSNYKPPSSLQVNQDIRKYFAESYFGNESVFYVEGVIAWRWLAIFPFDHGRLISDIRLSSDTITIPVGVQAEGAEEITRYIDMRWCDRDHPHDLFFATAFGGPKSIEPFKLGVSFEGDIDPKSVAWIGLFEIHDLVEQRYSHRNNVA